MSDIQLPQRPERKFLPQDLIIDSWEKLKPYFEEAEKQEISNIEDFKSWLTKISELEAVLEEDMAWRYIKMSLDTQDEKAAEDFHFFVEHIEPHIAPYTNKFDKKLTSVSFAELSSDEALKIVSKKAKFHIEIFREENIPLNTQLQAKSQEFGGISSKMSIDWEGKKLTMPQAAVLLKELDRSTREKAYKLIQTRRLEDRLPLHELFEELISLRHKVAQNSGYDNYRDYKFTELCRFDYTVDDCRNFHKSIAEEALPLIAGFDLERKEKLGLDSLKPWDSQVDLSGKEALKPFKDANDLIEKTVKCFNRLDPFFGECISIMNEMKYLDLDSRDGKAPGGFNYPLYEIGVPFIYMNSAGTVRDMVTMMHEGGHAVHSFLSRELELTSYKDLPSEVAELASMSMELMSMEHWDIFFENKEDLKRAKKEQLQQTVDTLPWVAQIDKFQHLLYENPTMTFEEREAVWLSLMDEFNSPVIDWTDLEKERKNLWQKQLHLFEVPFYYIEYGMAQLGAIAVWKNYKENPGKTVEQYKDALRLGYTKPIGEIYKTAGIAFDFSSEYVRELMQFVKSEIDALN